MRPLSQVDPWNGCEVCRRLFGRGVAPEHNWTHDLRMWWSGHFSRSCGKVPAWTYGTKPGHEAPEPQTFSGVKGPVWTTVGCAIAGLAVRRAGGLILPPSGITADERLRDLEYRLARIKDPGWTLDDGGRELVR